MASIFGLVNTLSVLLAARRPGWVEHGSDADATGGAPTSDTDGVHLQDSPRAMIVVDVREDAHRRTDRLTLSVVDLTGTYTIDVDGATDTYDAAVEAPADGAALIEGVRDMINAHSGLAQLVTASAEDADNDGNTDTLLLQGNAEASYALTVSTTGTGAWSVVAEPSSVDVRLWSRMRQTGGSPPAGWRVPSGGVFEGVDRRGLVERLGTGGVDRLYVEIDTITPASGDSIGSPSTVTYQPARVFVGPASLE